MQSIGKGHGIIKKLGEKNFVRRITVNLGGRGGSNTFLVLTDAGAQYLQDTLAMPVKKNVTIGGSFSHDLYVTKLKEKFEKWEIT